MLSCFYLSNPMNMTLFAHWTDHAWFALWTWSVQSVLILSFIINSCDSSSPGKFQHRMESSMHSVSYLFQCWQTIYRSVQTWATEHSFRVGVAGIYLVCFHVTLLHYYSPYCNTECHMNHFTNDVTLLDKTFLCYTSTWVFISTKQKRKWTILLLF